MHTGCHNNFRYEFPRRPWELEEINGIEANVSSASIGRYFSVLGFAGRRCAALYFLDVFVNAKDCVLLTYLKSYFILSECGLSEIFPV